MEKSVQHLQSIIYNYQRQLQSVDEARWIYKPNPSKWSRKEILGHLVDSAQNNIRRFIVTQYEEIPKITYAQDVWVAAANYQNYTIKDLITLWVLLNNHICIVLKNISKTGQERLCDANEIHAIKWLAEDYNKHLMHHLHQILDMEPVPYP